MANSEHGNSESDKARDNKTGHNIGQAAVRTLLNAWKSAAPVLKAGVLAGGGFAAGGMLSILYFSDIEGAIDNFFNDDEFEVSQIGTDTFLLTGGDLPWVVYKGVSCPLVMNWPDDKELIIGSTGDASLVPNDEVETSAITTILGSLGVTSDISAQNGLAENAQGLMADFYSYAQGCNSRIMNMQNQSAAPSVGGTTLDMAP